MGGRGYQLTLFGPKGADYARHITTGPPMFLDDAASLLIYRDRNPEGARSSSNLFCSDYNTVKKRIFGSSDQSRIGACIQFYLVNFGTCHFMHQTKKIVIHYYDFFF